MTKPLHVGDLIRLRTPGYGELSSQNRGQCFVARRTEVKVIRR